MDDPVMLVRVTTRDGLVNITAYHTRWTIAQAMREWLCDGEVMEILSIYEHQSEPFNSLQEKRFHDAERRYASCSSD